MTKADAQNILLRAFLSTGELPGEIEAVLLLVIQATSRDLGPANDLASPRA